MLEQKDTQIPVIAFASRRARLAGARSAVATSDRATMRPRPRRSPLPTTRSPPSTSTDADGWKVASPQDAMIRGNWWEVFNEPELNALEEQLNINNQNIKVYFQNYMAARATIAEARAQYWPTITATPSWNRSQDFRQSSSFLRGQHRQRHHPLESSRSMSPGRPTSGARSATRCNEAKYASQVSAADLELEKLTEQASLAEYFFEIRGQDMLQRFSTRPSSPIRKRSMPPRAPTTPASATTSPWSRPRPRSIP